MEQPLTVGVLERINYLEARGILNDYENKQLDLERYKKQCRCIRREIHKKWDE
jgi:hypothetical protein